MSDTRDTSGRSRDEWSGATDAHGADGRAERLDPHGPDGQGGGSREGTRRRESSWTSSSTYRHPGEAPVMHSRPTGPTYAGYDRTAAADRPTTSFPAAPGGYGTGGPGGPGARDEDPYGLTAAGEIIGARVIGSDVATDLAVLELDKAPQTLQPATFGNSDEVVVGDPVAAIGNPLGLSSTMTTGIVSALDRPVLAQDPNNARATSPVVTNAIQVDASVNPGNSGGALFDGAGRVIGVTSSIATTSATSGSVGLGFAIPANLAQRVVPQLIENGRAEHAYLGVSMNDGTATADGVTRTGANVLRVESGTPAAEAGLRAGDVIVAMDDKAIGGADALTGYVRGHSTGDQVRLTFVRGGSQQQVDVTLTTRPDNL